MAMSNTDISKMVRSCKVVKELFEKLYDEYDIYGISPYRDSNRIQMNEPAFFNTFPAKMIEKEEFDLDADRYFVELEGFKFFCIKEKEERE